MGRELSVAAGAAASSIVTMKAIDALAIGDVVANGASGKVGYVAPTNASPNRTVDDPVSTTAFLPIGTTGYEHPRFNNGMSANVIFDSGEEFLAYTGNGTTETTNGGYYNFSTGVKTVVVADTGIYISAFEKLNESSFLYLTTTANYGSLQFSIMGKDGTTVIKALTVLATINTYEGVDISSNGVDRIAIVYQTASGNYLTILDYFGNVIGTAKQLSTSGGPTYTKIKFLANGNILAYYTKAYTGYFTKQFTKEGVAVGTELQINTYTSAYYLLNSSSKALINSVGTDIYVLGTDNVSAYTSAYKISTTNTLVSSVKIGTQVNWTGHILITADGNVLFSAINGTTVNYALCTKSLAVIKTGNYGSHYNVSGQHATNNLFVAEVPNGYFVYSAGYTTTQWGGKVVFITPQFVVAGTSLALATGSGALLASSIQKYKGDIHLAGIYADNTNYVCKRVLSAGKQSIIGVATSTAITGGDVSVLVEGEATLSGNYSLVGAFDLRATVPYGNRGIVVGNKAAMFGIKV